jgi:hypothetical protein
MTVPTAAQTWTIDLPYDTPPLSLNDRMHHMVAYRLKKQLKADGRVLALSAKLPRGLDRVHIILHWQPPDRRHRDSDNPTATLKPLIDGLVAYGLVVDDNSAHVTSECVIEPAARPARTWLTITAGEALPA